MTEPNDHPPARPPVQPAPDPKAAARDAALRRIQGFRRFLMVLILSLSAMAVLLIGLIFLLQDGSLFCPAPQPPDIGAAVAVVEEAGFPTSYEQFAPQVPEQDNGFAPVLSALHLYVHDHDAANMAAAHVRGVSLDAMDPESNATAALAVWAEANAGMLSVLTEAVKRPHLRRTLDHDLGFTDWGPDAPAAFYPAYPLMARSLVRARAGDVAGAAADAAALARFARLLLEAPANLTELANGLMAASCVPAALAGCAAMDALAPETRAELLDAAAPLADMSAILSRGVQGQIVFLLDIPARYPASLLGRDFPEQLRQAVSLLVQCAALGERDYGEAAQEWEAATIVYNAFASTQLHANTSLSSALQPLDLTLAGYVHKRLQQSMIHLKNQ